MRSGTGKYIYKNGDIYEGEWKSSLSIILILDGNKHGIGRFMSDSMVYEGEWHHGERQGRGILTLSQGDVYEGYFNKGKKEGQGIYTWSNRNFYNGSGFI